MVEWAQANQCLYNKGMLISFPLQWRHNEHHGVIVFVFYTLVKLISKNSVYIKGPRCWPFVGESTGDRWIPAQMASNPKMIPFYDVTMHWTMHVFTRFATLQPRTMSFFATVTLVIRFYHLIIRCGKRYLNFDHVQNSCTFVSCPVWSRSGHVALCFRCNAATTCHVSRRCGQNVIVWPGHK